MTDPTDERGDLEHQLLDALADHMTDNGMRLATPEEMEVITDRAVTHVMAEEEKLRTTEQRIDHQGKPARPRGADFHETTLLLARQIREMVDDVGDASVAYNGNRDGYGKCVEVMWRAAYLAIEVVASELGVTGAQYSFASLMAFGQMRGYDGPFTVVTLDDALYPQYDLPGRVAGFIDEQRPWLAEQARALLAQEHRHASSNVVAHWEKLAAHQPEPEAAS